MRMTEYNAVPPPTALRGHRHQVRVTALTGHIAREARRVAARHPAAAGLIRCSPSRLCRTTQGNSPARMVRVPTADGEIPRSLARQNKNSDVSGEGTRKRHGDGVSYLSRDVILVPHQTKSSSHPCNRAASWWPKPGLHRVKVPALLGLEELGSDRHGGPIPAKLPSTSWEPASQPVEQGAPGGPAQSDAAGLGVRAWCKPRTPKVGSGVEAAVIDELVSHREEGRADAITYRLGGASAPVLAP